VHLSVGGSVLRIHISNAFGFTPLHLTSVHIAQPRSPEAAAIDPATDRLVSFSGQSDVTIPAGAEFISDPIDIQVAPLSDLAVSIHYDLPPVEQTGHPGSRATSYLVHGDVVTAADLPGARKFDRWYQLAAIDVVAQPDAAAIVTLGDSITDDHGATTNRNDRWTDVLAKRLQGDPRTKNVGVLNQGIGGNHLLTDGLGPNVLVRFDRDVLAQTGIRWVIVLEGVNDIGGFTRLGDRLLPSIRYSSSEFLPHTSKSSLARMQHTFKSWVPQSCLTPIRTITIRPLATKLIDKLSINGFEYPITSML
jgi:lysophospholipase L1-like esterase